MKYFTFLLLFFVFCGCSQAPTFDEPMPQVGDLKKDDSTVCAYIKCSKTKNLYLQKYAKQADGQYSPSGAFKLGEGVGAFPISDISRYAVSTEGVDLQNINPCPYCENERLGISSCEKMLCLPKSKSEVTKFNFCITIDNSGSMSGGGGLFGFGSGQNKLKAVKDAAKSFVQKRDLSVDKIGVVVFSDSAHIQSNLASDKNQIISAIDSIGSGGGTMFAQALQLSSQVLNGGVQNPDLANTTADNTMQAVENNKAVLFFTDGQNGDQQPTLQTANMLRNNGITIVAVATADGDRNYLAQMTGAPAKVIIAGNDDIGAAFKQAEEVIERTVINKASTGNSGKGTKVVCPWCEKEETFESGGKIGGSGG
jgi:Mg-chelatase subunit ChlD